MFYWEERFWFGLEEWDRMDRDDTLFNIHRVAAMLVAFGMG